MKRMIRLLAGTLVMPWVMSCLLPGGGYAVRTAFNFRLDELEFLGLSEEQTSRQRELDNHYQAEMKLTLQMYEKLYRDRRPTSDQVRDMESEMNLLLDTAWFSLRSVLTEEQLARLETEDPTHPLARDEAPRFYAPPMGGGPRDGGPGSRGGW